MRIHPFTGLVVDPAAAQQVASVPYDVVDTAEARALATGNPASFLHVVRAEVDLPEDTDPHADIVYQTAARRLADMEQQGLFRRDAVPTLYAYRIRSGDHVQTGLLACAHLDDYERGVIKKHELTRQDKEDDRTRHILATQAQSGPVLLTFRDDPAIARQLAAHTRGAPDLQARAEDGVEHQIWRLKDNQAMCDAFAAVPAAYIADGHHRSASAARARAGCRQSRPQKGPAEYDYFLVVLFPASELRILAYNRLVRDLNGHAPQRVLELAGERFDVTRTDRGVPARPRSMCVYLAGQWWQLTAKPGCVDASDPVAALDCSLIQTHFIEPILGIRELRTDPRITFAGGHLGPEVLQHRVDSGAAAIAIAVYPTSIDELLTVADAGAIMPPKSTWFDPKLRSGLVVHKI